MRHNPPSPSRLTRYFILNVIKFTSDSRKGKPEKNENENEMKFTFAKVNNWKKNFFILYRYFFTTGRELYSSSFFMLIQLLLAVKGMSLFWVVNTCWHDSFVLLCVLEVHHIISFSSFLYICQCVHHSFLRCVFDYVKNAEMR